MLSWRGWSPKTTNTQLLTSKRELRWLLTQCWPTRYPVRKKNLLASFISSTSRLDSRKSSQTCKFLSHKKSTFPKSKNAKSRQTPRICWLCTRRIRSNISQVSVSTWLSTRSKAWVLYWILFFQRFSKRELNGYAVDKRKEFFRMIMIRIRVNQRMIHF